MQKILIIDDDHSVCFSISLLLKRAGFATAFIHHPKGLNQAIQREQPDLILLDMNFTIDTSGKQGLKALDQIRTIDQQVPIILMTGWATVELAVKGMKKGATDFIAKPWDNKQLLNTVRTILALKSAQQSTVDSGMTDFDRIIGSKHSLKNLIETARRISRTDASVLILGESGTGKELLAEAIHQESQRSNQPFIRVNMGGIPVSLFESEMFGHKKGAFTDASTDREGRFAAADGGTIFLDEIGDLPLESQVKLLRVLQEQTFEPVGSSKPQKVNVRVISATNKNLEAMVTSGEFREDLYYRINLIKLELPPLRQRIQDMPVLVETFLKKLGQNYGRQEVQIDESAVNWMQRQRFPGNIRQLKNLIERTVLMSGKDRLSLNDFKPYYQDFDSQQNDLPEVGTLSLEEMEVQMIRKALDFHQKNISLTAKSLGLTRSALYRRLQNIKFRMTIKVKYFLFVGLIHALITYLVFLLLQDQKVYFIFSEILIIISIALSVQIYLAFIRPLQFMANGINALEDEDFSIQYLQTGSLELNKLVEVYNQMIENIRNERVAIQEQHYFLQRLIQAYPAAIIILDYDDKISELNPRAEALLEKAAQKLIGRKLQELEHPIAAAIIATELGASQVINGKGIERYKCEIAEFIHRGFRRKFIQVSELSKEMLAAEKRAYGKVIRMMAHEVNNSIGATNSILNIGVDYLEGLEAEGQEEIQQALQLAIDRNHSLSQFMRNFAEVVRLPQPNKELVSIVKLLRDVARYMAPVAKEKEVEFKTAFLEAEGQQAILDPQQMEQALVNIVKNAIEATGQGGIIRFEIQIDPLTIVIANNGLGIDPSLKDQLFTPFFSTKVDGQGIGLTLVREIVMNHNATIDLETRDDGWTYCTVTFSNRY